MEHHWPGGRFLFVTSQDRASIAGVGTIVVVFALLALLFALFVLRPREPRPDSIEGAGPLADPSATYDPVKAGEETPRGYRQLLGRDRITPIYDPEFVSASKSEWPDDALVIGIASDGEAKAYPVSHLNSREMVIDRIAGIPVLVTW